LFRNHTKCVDFGQWSVFENEFKNILQGVLQIIPQCHPETTKDFYNMCKQYVTYSPNSISPYVEPIFISAMTTISASTERHSVRSALSIITTFAGFVDISCENPATTTPLVFTTTNVFKTHGYALTRLLLQGIGKSLPRNQLDIVGEVIYLLVTHVPSFFRQWAKQLFLEPDFPSAHLKNEQKETFLNSIMRAKGKPAFKNLVQDLSIRARALGDFGTATNPIKI